MSITREQIIEAARVYVRMRCKYAFQGSNPQIGFDCGQYPLRVGHDLGITALSFLGYSNNPDGETYERLLNENLIRLPEIEGATKPNIWNALPGDLLAFDLGKGIQHIAIITKFENRRFTVCHSVRVYNVIEAPLFGVYITAKKYAYRIPGVID